MKHEIGERKSLKVLFLLDSSLEIDRICNVLLAAGYDVKADSAREPTALAASIHSHTYDVILSSFTLSALDAFEALSVCTDVCPEVPFICVSGSIGEVSAVELVKRGAADHVLTDHLERLPEAVQCAIEEAGKGQLRQQVEHTLRQSEERYRALFHFSPDALYVHVSGLAVLVNPAFCRLLGAEDPAQLIGRSVLEIVHPDFHEKIRERWDLLTNGKPAPLLEERFIRLDGTEIDVEVRAVPIDWEGSQAVQVIVHDIAERKRAEEALKKTEGLYRIVFENTGTATVLIEEDTIISLANTEFEKLSQFSKAEIEGKKSWTEFVAVEDLDRMRAQHFARRNERGAALKQYEFRFVRREGSVRHILLTIDMIPGTKRSVASLLDISERKWAEEGVRDSEERFRMVFEHVFDGICIYAEDPDPAKRTLIECNEQYAAMAGRSREELLRIGVTQSLQRTPDQSANVSRLRSLAGGKSFRGSFSWIRPDGEDNVIEYLGTPITWRGKQYSIGIDRDITQWKRAEERLEALANERGTLLKEIYHRVNNNLQVVSSLLNLQARQVNDERFSELLRESQLRVRAMALVHERLYRSQNLSSIDFGEYLQGEIGELRLAFGRPGVTLLLDVEPIPFPIELAIPTGLIVNELVINAFKHAFPGDRNGRVTVSLHRRDKSTVQLGVDDDGVGLPEGMDPIKRTSMGLSLVRDLVQQIGGTLTFSQGEGSSISVTLSA